MKNQKLISDVFFQADHKEWENVDQGISRQFVGYDTQIMMVKVRFEAGAIGYEHQHFHAQTTYVASGKFRVTIGGEERELSEGDGFYIPPNVMHGAVCLEAGMFIDVFSPVREDFLDINFTKK